MRSRLSDVVVCGPFTVMGGQCSEAAKLWLLLVKVSRNEGIHLPLLEFGVGRSYGFFFDRALLTEILLRILAIHPC